jgi:hypothetical protein
VSAEPNTAVTIVQREEPSIEALFSQMTPIEAKPRKPPAKDRLLRVTRGLPEKPLWLAWAEIFASLRGPHKDEDFVSLGHLAGTDYEWNAEHQMWLPDARGNLFLQTFMNYYEQERRRHQRDGGRMFEEPLAPSTITAVLAHARQLCALSPRDVAITEPGRFLQPGEIGRRGGLRWLARLGGAPVIPATGIGVFYGYSEAYKSYVAVNLAVALGAGRPDLGGLGLDCPEGSWVLYVGAEDADGLDARIAAARRQLSAEDARVLLFNQPVIMTDPTTVLDLVRQGKQSLPAGAPVAAVILDTYNQTLGPGDDENSADTARNYTIGMRLLGRAFGAVVITIHHPPKGDGDQLRGSGALENNVDFALRFEREEGAMRTRVSGRKQKNGPKFAPFTVAFADSTAGMVLAEIEAGARASQKMKDVLTKAQREVLQVLAEHRGPLQFGAWAKLATDQLGISEALVQKTRSRAKENNLIALTVKDGWELTPFGRAYAHLQGWSTIV